ncbi:oligosaccharide flippase family protein [Acinetobacter pollinis]|uniref:Oligosaccharide flippase family protein n=1 Tax=Acinetobacter pollinis TaxID=2605270 RepID=A0ABU6DT34_9GAMM|nr:oligosaccharide flippase family protein [Acinetobacter pollinis]MEB5476807.1 oligosaccharide flippase family protein [Acinetobacter pollinis]
MNSVKKELSYLYLIQISNFIIPLIIFPYMTHILGVSGMGKIGFAQTLYFLFAFFIDFGFNLSSAKNISLNLENKKLVDQIYSNIQVFKTIIFSIVLIIIIFIMSIFNFTNLDKQIILIACICSFGSVLIPNFLFNGLSRNSTLAIISFITRILLLIPVFLYVKGIDDILVAILCIIGNNIITGFLVQLYLLKFKYTNFKFSYLNFGICKNEIREAFDNYSASFFTLGFTYLIPLVVKYSLGDYALGIYTMVDKLIAIFRQLYIPVIQSFFSKACIAYKNDLNLYLSYIKQICLIFIFLGMSALIGNILIGKEILSLIFGNIEDLSKYLSLAIITQIIISIAIILVNFYIIPSERSYILKRVYFIAFLFFIPIVYLCQKYFNLDGIYYSMQIIEFFITLFFVLYLYFNRSDFKVLKNNGDKEGL